MLNIIFITTDINRCNVWLFKFISPLYRSLAGRAYNMSETIRESGRYDTGRIGTRGNPPYPAVLYRKRLRHDTLIVQLCQRIWPRGSRLKTGTYHSRINRTNQTMPIGRCQLCSAKIIRVATRWRTLHLPFLSRMRNCIES